MMLFPISLPNILIFSTLLEDASWRTSLFKLKIQKKHLKFDSFWTPSTLTHTSINCQWCFFRLRYHHYIIEPILTVSHRCSTPSPKHGQGRRKKTRFSDPRTRKLGGVYSFVWKMFFTFDFVFGIYMFTPSLSDHWNIDHKSSTWKHEKQTTPVKKKPGSFDARLATFRKIVEQRRTCSCTSLYLHRCCDLESHNVGTFFGAGKSWKKPIYVFGAQRFVKELPHFYIMELWQLIQTSNMPSAKKNIRSKHQTSCTFAATTGYQIPAPWIKILHLLWVEPASGGIWSTFFSVAKPLRHCLC